MKICVIGAGPSGICAAKEIKEHNPLATITILEKAHTLGGLFASSYKGLTLVNNPLLVSFSDFLPWEALNELQMWTAEQYVSYLQRYADANGVTDLIQFNTVVKSARLVEGKWNLNIIESTVEKKATFDYIVICSGSNGKASLPVLPNQQNFAGKILHSSDVKNPADFAGQNVVFLGLGETASDLSYFTAEYARSTTVSVRRWPGYFIPRYHDGRPTDIDTSKIYHCLPKNIDSSRLSFLFKLKRFYEVSKIRTDVDKKIQTEINRLNAHWPNVRNVGPFRRISTKSCGFIRGHLDGSVALKPAIKELCGNIVYFTDGSSVLADVIVCCTGHKYNYDFLPKKFVERVPSSNVLYRYMFLPDHESNLAFVGFVRPAVGTVPALAELQSRMLALFLNGSLALPSVRNMRVSIEQQKLAAQSQFPLDFSRVGHIVDYYSYMQDLAKTIGVMPKQWSLFLFDPKICFKINFSFLCPGMFRLYGPGAKAAHVKPVIKRLPTMPPVVLFIEALTYLLCRMLSFIGFKRFKTIR